MGRCMEYLSDVSWQCQMGIRIQIFVASLKGWVLGVWKEFEMERGCRHAPMSGNYL